MAARTRKSQRILVNKHPERTKKVETAQNQVNNSDDVVYTVQTGDTLSSLTTLFGTTAEALIKSNPQKLVDPPSPGDLLCVPGAHIQPTYHSGRRCLPLKRTLVAPDVEAIAYLNYITNVVLLVAGGLPPPASLHACADVWIMWLVRSETDTYLRFPLEAGRNGLYGTRAEMTGPLLDLDEIIISAEEKDAVEPNGWRVLVADLALSYGPF